MKMITNLNGFFVAAMLISSGVAENLQDYNELGDAIEINGDAYYDTHEDSIEKAALEVVLDLLGPDFQKSLLFINSRYQPRYEVLRGRSEDDFKAKNLNQNTNIVGLTAKNKIDGHYTPCFFNPVTCFAG